MAKRTGSEKDPEQEKEREQNELLPTLSLPPRKVLPPPRPIHAEMPRPQLKPKYLYWLGVMPVVGEVDMVFPSSKKEDVAVIPETGERISYAIIKKVTALQQWQGNHSEGDLPDQSWLGAAGHQNIGVNGWTFHAFSVTPQPSPGSLDPARLVYPGQVAPLDETQVEQIVQVCSQRQFFRRPTHLKRDGNSIMMDVMFGVPPKDYNPQNPQERPITPHRQYFDPDSDKWVAQFVYIYRLPNDVKSEPRLYHTFVPTMEEFLMDPPKALAKFAEPKKEPAGVA